MNNNRAHEILISQLKSAKYGRTPFLLDLTNLVDKGPKGNKHYHMGCAVQW